jgi:hypothetical protein
VELKFAAGSLVATAISFEYYSLKSEHLKTNRNKAFMRSGVLSAMLF